MAGVVSSIKFCSGTGFFFFLSLVGYVEEKPLVAYTKSQQRKKEESEQLRG